MTSHPTDIYFMDSGCYLNKQTFASVACMGEAGIPSQTGGFF